MNGMFYKLDVKPLLLYNKTKYFWFYIIRVLYCIYTDNGFKLFLYVKYDTVFISNLKKEYKGINGNDFWKVDSVPSCDRNSRAWKLSLLFNSEEISGMEKKKLQFGNIEFVWNAL